MIDMEKDEYVDVTIIKFEDGIRSSMSSMITRPTVDDAIAFLQKYKDEQTAPLL